MSQEPPNSQPSPPPESGVELSKTTDNNITQSPQTAANRSQSAFKTQIIKVLRGTIRLLEGTVVKLEEPSTPTQPGWGNKLQAGWQVVLDKIRALLPENLSSKLSDLGLTSIIIVIVGLLLGTISVSLLQEKPTKVATVPPSETVTVPEPAPTNIVPPSTTAPTPPAPPKSDPLPDLIAPAESKPIAIAPPPEPVLTPEQNLIAAIENQVAEVTDRYADGLIQSIQVNFQGSRLAIKVGDDWYTLNQSQQDKLASRMLERARQLDFSRLEITDPQGTLIARSPVVGDSMVILKR